MGLVRSCLRKAAASLQNLVVEEHGQESQNVRRLSWPETYHVVPMERRRQSNHQIFIGGYLQFVDTKQMHAALCSSGYGASTVARQCTSCCPIVVQQQPWRMVPWSHPEAPEVMAAMYTLGGEYVLLAVVSILLKHYKTTVNPVSPNYCL